MRSDKISYLPLHIEVFHHSGGRANAAGDVLLISSCKCRQRGVEHPIHGAHLPGQGQRPEGGAEGEELLCAGEAGPRHGLLPERPGNGESGRVAKREKKEASYWRGEDSWRPSIRPSELMIS